MKGVRQKSPWLWIPSLYFAQGLPYVAVMMIAVILYKRMGLGNAEIALYTSWLYLPWVIKPLWSPFVDLAKTKRWWIVTMQSLIAVGFAGIAFFIPTTYYLQLTLAFFWLLAFSSATHDIAADGFYMLSLNTGEQSFFVGIRNTFYRFAMIFGQGILVAVAGFLEKSKNNIPLAWSITFFLLAGIFIALSLYHKAVLPKPTEDTPRGNLTPRELLRDFWKTFVSFFTKDDIGLILFFLLTYRLGEAQLLKLSSPFMLDPVSDGGLGLDTATVGVAYGTLGVAALLAGGILGGIVVSRDGFRKWIIPMALCLNLADLFYVFLAIFQPENILFITSCIVLEQLGYGFGFTAYTLFLISIANGTYKTAHYAIGTGFMALGMMLPGMIAGWLQETMGYTLFFWWVCLCTAPGIVAAFFVSRKIDPVFGKK
ncbi:MAG: MFS transporter [Massilibacteroides sp.]|nr:MFS transporter [Massilibacteroides sp.]MDD3062189.1 MFS transporter [Massilibacteroides sp.]MDD4114415.1 MFS transporter [Massilibacteroides sp.]MDD4659707.1 MFS transporter [Massilibacteroides sp.]